MSFFSKTEKIYYEMHIPVMGDSYTYTVKYGKNREKTPLDARMTREMLQLHAQEFSNVDNMKVQLKDLREIHNIPMLRKTSNFQSVKGVLLDKQKISSYYGSEVVKMENDLFGNLASEYIVKITNGKYNNVLEIKNYIINTVIPEIEKFIGKADSRKYSIFKIDSIVMNYMGNNVFFLEVQSDLAEHAIDPKEHGQKFTRVISKKVSLLLTFPEELYYIWELVNSEKNILVKLANGNIVYINDDNYDTFTSSSRRELDFSIPIGMKNTISSPKDYKTLEIAKQKLYYQEKKNKKRNRQELLYETLQKSTELENACFLNMYLDLYPFKDPTIRNDKNWRLFLKGVMRYFARICNIAEVDNGRGNIFVEIPLGVSLRKTPMYMNIEMTKEVVPTLYNNQKPINIFEELLKRNNGNVSSIIGNATGQNPQFSVATPLCFFEYENKQNDNPKYSDRKEVWLYLVVEAIPGKYIKYGLNFSKFYNGLTGVNVGRSLSFTILKEVNEEFRNKYSNEGFIGKDYYNNMDEDIERSRVHEALEHYMLEFDKSTRWWNYTDDATLWKIDKNTGKIKYEIPQQFQLNDTSDTTANDIEVPRMPMPILMWNMIPYSAKKVSYTSSLLLYTVIIQEVETSTGWGEAISFIVTMGAMIFSAGTLGAAIAAGTATATSTAISIAAMVGSLVALAGSLSGNKIVSLIGTIISVVTSIGNITQSFDKLSTFKKLTTIADVLTDVNRIVTNFRNINFEQALVQQAEDLQKSKDNFEKEIDSRLDTWGGVVRTSAAADEEIDQLQFLTSTDFLGYIVEQSIEPNFEINHNDRKYDNTR